MYGRLDALKAGTVALLAEGVDRNSIACDRQSGGQKVALLAEGVDRNICYINGVDYLAGVALLAEGVDRNSNPSSSTTMQRPSPSSRRAWIEITRTSPVPWSQVVALLAEGVDRNRYDPAKYEARVRVALLAEGVDRNPHV